MITSAGVGSGIDIESIISQLMTLERQPLNKLETKKSTINVQISAFGSLQSAIDKLQTAAKKLGDSDEFGRYIASSSDEDVFTATATTGTSAENHSVNVLSLASAHRMSSGLFASAADPVGTGTYSFSSGSESFDVTIDGTNDSLTGLRDAINNAAGNTSVSASIINVDGGSRLVLTAKNSGTANAIIAPGMFTEITAATDAQLEVDGFAVTSSSNSVKDVIPGVVLELKAQGTAELNTARDRDSIRESLDTFVEAYNELRTKIGELRSGTLRGDSMLLGIESGLRQKFFSPIDLGNGESVSVFDLGLTFDKTGVLSVNSGKLDEAVEGNIENLVKAFGGATDSFSARLETYAKAYTQADGLIDGRKDGLDSRSRSLDSQIERYEYRLELTELRFRKQFTAMDSMVAQLQATSNYMLQQLNSLNQSSN